MRAKVVVATVGYVLVGLIIFGLVLTIVAALLMGNPFYGRNAYGLLLGTYSSAAVVIIAGVVGVVWAARKARRRRGQR